MIIREYLEKEIKRLNRINDLLENEAKTNLAVSIQLEEMIQKNTLAMCEIAKVL